VNNAIIALLLVVITIALSLGVFSLYSFYFSNVQYSVSTQGNVITVSKYLQIEVSNLAYFYNSKGNDFNVSYLIWVSVPVTKVVVLPFVVSPMNYSLLYYYIPNQTQNASLFYSSQNGYKPLNSFTISNNIYLPQEGILLGKVSSLSAFNVSSNTTYILSAKLNLNQIIVVWILYYYQGKWYRLGYTYLNPFDQGVGLYVVSSTGNYNSYSKALQNANAPHFVTSQKAIGFGLWFKPIANSSIKALILNLSFVATNGNNVSLMIFQQNEKLYVYSTLLSSSQSSQTFLCNLNLNQWYFINISYGAITGNSKSFNITLYSNGKILNYTNLPSYTQLNGYNISVKFGSSTLADAISQAFLVSAQSSNGLGSFYNVSKIMLKNGPFYNNTLIFNETIVNSKNLLYDIGYWYFVWPTSNPPSQISGILWYYPQGNYQYPLIYYIPESGQNTYVIA